jgi:hypothetical protein
MPQKHLFLTTRIQIIIKISNTRCQWLTPVILATDGSLKQTPSNYFKKPYLEKPITKKGLTEWLKW